MEKIERKFSLSSSMVGQILPFILDSLEKVFQFLNSLLLLSCKLLDGCQVWGNLYQVSFKHEISGFGRILQSSLWLCTFEIFLHPEFTCPLYLRHLPGMLSEPP